MTGTTSDLPFHCPACGTDLEAFAPGPGGRPNARCPNCQALERHRLLTLMLRERGALFGTGTRVLDVAPAGVVRRFLLERVGRRYVGTDMFMSGGVSARSDLTRAPFASQAFDVIVCYHVLEHIPDDHAAIVELARVLHRDGVAFIQVPRRPGTQTDEDPSAPVEERISRFGQDDHVRFYGDDFEERLLAGGLVPTVLRPAEALPERDVTRFGLVRNEEVWVCARADRRRSEPRRENRYVRIPVPKPPLSRRLVRLAKRIPRGALRRLGLLPRRPR
jgi:SAM-dependent methyltransferase